MSDLDLNPPDDPAETTARLITAAGNGDCIRIALLVWARTVADTPFTRDDILADWIATWPQHQNPPFRRRPLQRMNLAWPIVYATGLLEPVGDDPELRKVAWPAIAYFLSERIGYANQKEAQSPTGVDVAVPVDEAAVAAIGILVAELSNLRAAGIGGMDLMSAVEGGRAADWPSNMTLTVDAEVIKGGGS